MIVDIPDGALKIRQGEYVIYKVDYLLDHLAAEVALMENCRHKQVGVFDENLAREIRRECGIER